MLGTKSMRNTRELLHVRGRKPLLQLQLPEAGQNMLPCRQPAAPECVHVHAFPAKLRAALLVLVASYVARQGGVRANFSTAQLQKQLPASFSSGREISEMGGSEGGRCSCSSSRRSGEKDNDGCGGASTICRISGGGCL
jgi:hypothetical protein